jgi:hypothetical protein
VKARGAAYAASAKSLPGINSAFLIPMLRYSPDSITPMTDYPQTHSRKKSHAKKQSRKCGSENKKISQRGH